MPQLADSMKCTGCAACANSCNHQAITMQPDAEGFLMPVVDGEKCVECKLCEKSCPVITVNECTNTVSPKTFAMWSNPDRTVSSSGGAFSAFARVILAKGGVVFGAAFDKELNCRHTEAHTLEELAPLRGSKYVQSDNGTIYNAVKKYLKEDRWVLYTGTPCQIVGLYAFLRKSYDKLVTLDLACHGVPSNKIFQAYLKKLKIYRPGLAGLEGYEFRRRNGWGKAPSITVRSKLTPIYDTDALYMCAFDRAAIFRNCCYDCKYARMPRVGDCSIADFWGLGRYGKPFKHNVLKGVSLILVNNEKGEAIVSEMKDVFIEERTLEEALIENHNLKSPSKKDSCRDEIIKAFLDKDKTLVDIDRQFHLVDHSLKGIVKKYASKYHLFDVVKRMYNFYKAH